MKLSIWTRFRIRRLVRKINRLMIEETNPHTFIVKIRPILEKLVKISEDNRDVISYQILDMSGLNISTTYSSSFDMLDDISMMTNSLLSSKYVRKQDKLKRLSSEVDTSVSKFFSYNNRLVLCDTVNLTNVACNILYQDIKEYVDPNSLTEPYLQGYATITSMIWSVLKTVMIPYGFMSGIKMEEVIDVRS